MWTKQKHQEMLNFIELQMDGGQLFYRYSQSGHFINLL